MFSICYSRTHTTIKGNLTFFGGGRGSLLFMFMVLANMGKKKEDELVQVRCGGGLFPRHILG